MKYLVGLTGLIGSGKSMVAKHFASLDIDIIDTDAIAHELTEENGEAINAIKQVFGPIYITPNNALNRNLMRERIFSDVTAKTELENILHPLIFIKTQELITQSNSIYTIIMVPLLFKSLKYMSLINQSIFVDCKEKTLIQRVMLRSHLNAMQIKTMLRAQAPRYLQLSLCDHILNNNTSIEELYNSVLKLDLKLRRFCQNILCEF